MKNVHVDQEERSEGSQVRNSRSSCAMSRGSSMRYAQSSDREQLESTAMVVHSSESSSESEEPNQPSRFFIL